MFASSITTSLILATSPLLELAGEAAFFQAQAAADAFALDNDERNFCAATGVPLFLLRFAERPLHFQLAAVGLGEGGPAPKDPLADHQQQISLDSRKKNLADQIRRFLENRSLSPEARRKLESALRDLEQDGLRLRALITLESAFRNICRPPWDKQQQIVRSERLAGRKGNFQDRIKLCEALLRKMKPVLPADFLETWAALKRRAGALRTELASGRPLQSSDFDRIRREIGNLETEITELQS